MVDYEDERFAKVEANKKQALTDIEQTYGGMIGEAQKYYQSQIDASKEWASTQQNLQQAQTDFTIEQIEQQKEQAQKDYMKEQSGAYVDYKKESNRYSAGAEEMAAAGLSESGYSESSQVSMYNTYQNRVATAREAYNLAVMNYNNAIKEAQLQNSSALAEIAYYALQQELELALQGFQYENQLVLDNANKKTEIENIYNSRYLEVLDQINTENALAEQIRQYEKNYAFKEKEYEEGVRQYEEELKRLKELDAQENALAIQKLELQKAQLEEEKRQFDAEFNASSDKNELYISKQEKSESTNSSESTYKPGVLLDNAVNKINQNLMKRMKEDATSTTGSGNTYSGTTKSGNTYSGGSKRICEVNTDYYQGDMNSDAKIYGTFSNGYQPKGISGHGKLKKTGKKTEVDTWTLSGKLQTVVQNIWEAEDGTKWYWQGRDNKYIQLQ